MTTITIADADGVLVHELDVPEPDALESRAELRSLDALQAERRALLVQLAPLKARHGSFGTWDAKRKQLVEALKVRHRARLIAEGVKTTETMIDAEAHADEQYARFLDQAERDKVQFLLLDNRLSEIEEQIKDREFRLLAYNAEARLTR